MATIELLCPRCNSEKVIFSGYNYTKTGRTQRLKCQCCGSKFQDSYQLSSYKAGVKEQIIEMLHNGSGVRDISRVLKVGTETVLKEVKKKVFSVKYLNEDFIKKQLDNTERDNLMRLEIEIWLTAEADEMWSWVQCKQNQRWLWWIIDKKTGEVLAFTFGKRTNEVWKLLLEDLKEMLDKYDVSYDILYTDGHQAYKVLLFTALHIQNNNGKNYTWQIERMHLTLRTRIKRLQRKTICFSKCEILHDIIIGLFINSYWFNSA